MVSLAEQHRIEHKKKKIAAAYELQSLLTAISRPSGNLPWKPQCICIGHMLELGDLNSIWFDSRSSRRDIGSKAKIMNFFWVCGSNRGIGPITLSCIYMHAMMYSFQDYDDYVFAIVVCISFPLVLIFDIVKFLLLVVFPI